MLQIITATMLHKREPGKNQAGGRYGKHVQRNLARVFHLINCPQHTLWSPGRECWSLLKALPPLEAKNTPWTWGGNPDFCGDPRQPRRYQGCLAPFTPHARPLLAICSGGEPFDPKKQPSRWEAASQIKCNGGKPFTLTPRRIGGTLLFPKMLSSLGLVW